MSRKYQSEFQHPDEKIMDLKRKIQSQKQKIKKLNDDFTSNEEENAEEIENLQKLIKKLKDKNKKLVTDLNEESIVDESEVTSLKRKLEAAKIKLKDKQKELDELASSSFELQRLKHEFDNQKCELEVLTLKYEDVQKTKRYLEESHSNGDGIQTLIQKLTDRDDELKEKEKTIQNMKQKMLKVMKLDPLKIEAENSQLGKNVEILQTENRSLQNEKVSIELERDSLKVDLSRCQVEIRAMKKLSIFE